MSQPTAGTILERLPEDVQRAVAPLFEALPLREAMPDLVPRSTSSKEAHKLADEAVRKLCDPALKAAVWLYVDDLQQSHEISQSLHDQTGSMWHAIMHRREGDFGNAKYWLRQAGNHPALRNFDFEGFVDEVARRHSVNPSELVEEQRREWRALFEWCARGPGAA